MNKHINDLYEQSIATMVENSLRINYRQPIKRSVEITGDCLMNTEPSKPMNDVEHRYASY